MSDDIFIKNPNREAAKHPVPYEPEHIRLNKKAIPMGDRMAPEQPANNIIFDKPLQENNIDDEMFVSVDGKFISSYGAETEEYNNPPIPPTARGAFRRPALFVSIAARAGPRGNVGTDNNEPLADHSVTPGGSEE